MKPSIKKKYEVIVFLWNAWPNDLPLFTDGFIFTLCPNKIDHQLIDCARQQIIAIREGLTE